MRCLIVNDFSGEQMVEAIHDLGHAATLVNTSAEAKAYLRAGGVDVLITDDSLPAHRIGEVVRMCQSYCPSAHIMNTSEADALPGSCLPDQLVRLLASPAYCAAPSISRPFGAALSWGV